jgi:hypothetical protein
LRDADGDRAATIALADRIVHTLLLGSSANDVLYSPNPLIEHLRLAHRTVDEIAGNLASETDDLKYAMLARSHEDAWPDAMAPLRRQLQGPFRPLITGPAEQFNPCRLLVTRLAGDYANETCNIGIIWAADAGACELALVQYERLEREVGCGQLPVLMVYGAGHFDEDWWARQDRPRASLSCPVSIRTFVRTVGGLLDR